MKVLVFIVSLAWCQETFAKKDTLITYHRVDGSFVTKRDYYSFYRKSFLLSDGRTGVYDYSPGGRLKMTGAFESADFYIRSGDFVYYDWRGSRAEEGKFEDDLKTGTWIKWHPDGTRATEGNYSRGKKNGEWQQWYPNGNLQSQGIYKDDQPEAEWKEWYENGMRQSEGVYYAGQKEGEWQYWYESGGPLSVGSFDKGKRTGFWRSWHDNAIMNAGTEPDTVGNVELKVGSATYVPGSEGSYVEGKEDGLWTYWHENGNLSSVGSYKAGLFVGEWKAWYDNGKPDYSGSYVDGKMNGEWKFYFESGAVSAIETWENGKAIVIQFWNEDGEEVPVTEPLEIDPQFPGGEKAMMEFIVMNVQYPELSREMGEQGIVYVQFVVNRDGALSDVKILKSVSPLLDAETLRVVGLMPNWEPGISHNRVSSVRFVLPINFKIY